uniref:Uncharacterized protein n=1 Tax=Anguilla anguilla TaxID=7936 RepID=A0A0E9R997_ANGAN
MNSDILCMHIVASEPSTTRIESALKIRLTTEYPGLSNISQTLRRMFPSGCLSNLVASL